MDTAEVGKMPTHAIIAATSDYKTKATVGALWAKEGQYGKFLSGELKNKVEKDGKTFPGYSIVEDSYLAELEHKLKFYAERIKDLESQIPPKEKTEFEKKIDEVYQNDSKPFKGFIPF